MLNDRHGDDITIIAKQREALDHQPETINIYHERVDHGQLNCIFESQLGLFGVCVIHIEVAQIDVVFLGGLKKSIISRIIL